jgi:hypothetical protein
MNSSQMAAMAPESEEFSWQRAVGITGSLSIHTLKDLVLILV